MRKFFIVFLMLTLGQMFAQELNCNLVVNAKLTGNENDQIFKNLERQLTEFINNSSWTNKSFNPQERINCNMVVTVNEQDNDMFLATLQIQASRPVFNSTYNTPIYNFNDKNFSFRYIEFQNLVFNPNQYESNLVSVLAFHIYMILGIDADTFSPNGGDPYFKQAQTILNYSQQEGFKGWKREDGNQSRFALIDALLSNSYKEFREVMYAYHRDGLDQMYQDQKMAKTTIADEIQKLKNMHNRRPNSFLMRMFFDTKADEIESIFSDGPKIKITELVSTLTRIAPMHASKWRNITF